MTIRTLLAYSLLLAGCAESIPAPTTLIVPASPPAPVPPPAPVRMEPPPAPTPIASPALPSVPPPAASASVPPPPVAGNRKHEEPAAQLYTVKPGDPGAVEFGMISQVKTPQIKTGAPSVSGRLPPEVIQGIVSKNLGRFRLCYQDGLKVTPTLFGRISVRFVIGKDGATTAAKNGGSDLVVIGKDGAPTAAPPNTMVDCVVKAFKDLKYPAPDGGVVLVVYPIMFSPGDAAAPASPPPAAPKSQTDSHR